MEEARLRYLAGDVFWAHEAVSRLEASPGRSLEWILSVLPAYIATLSPLQLQEEGRAMLRSFESCFARLGGDPLEASRETWETRNRQRLHIGFAKLYRALGDLQNGSQQGYFQGVVQAIGVFLDSGSAGSGQLSEFEELAFQRLAAYLSDSV